MTRYAVLFSLVILTLLIGCLEGRQTKLDADQPVAEEQVLSTPPTTVDRYAETIADVAIATTFLGAVLAVGGLVAAIGVGIKAGKDVAFVGMILLLASGALAAFSDYAKVIVVVASVVFAGYYVWLLWRRYQDEKVQAELYESAEYLKAQTDWTEYAKDHLRKVQSPATRKVVDKLQGKE